MGINMYIIFPFQQKKKTILRLEFWPYPSKHWNTDLPPASFGLLTLSLETLAL